MVLAPILFPEKNQGISLQRMAFDQTDLLPLYGSSELVNLLATRLPISSTYPTNFNVFPVGKAGAASLILLQKGRRGFRTSRGKNYIISISPTWFFKESVPVAYYDGNFSLLQAGELIYSREISFDLKPDVARRMLKYPKELEKSFLLAFALKQLASGSPTNRVFYYVTVPLGRLEMAFCECRTISKCFSIFGRIGDGCMPTYGVHLS